MLVSKGVAGTRLLGWVKPCSRPKKHPTFAPEPAEASVVLALESTFEEAAGRGKVPPGLRAGVVRFRGPGRRWQAPERHMQADWTFHGFPRQEAHGYSLTGPTSANRNVSIIMD